MNTLTREQFLDKVKNHKLTIHKDDGVYRHITIHENDSNDYRFDIVTFPGYLVVTGYMGTLTFSRIKDVFNFFRNDDLNIDPGCWSEKIKTVSYKAKDASFQEFDLKTAINSFKEMIARRLCSQI